MSDYKYISPLDKGYKRLKLSKKTIQSFLSRRKFKWYSKIELYYHIEKDQFIMHESRNWLFIVLVSLLMPFIILLSLKDSPEAMKEYFQLWNQKKHGTHRSDYIYRDTDLYKKIMTHIGTTQDKL